MRGSRDVSRTSESGHQNKARPHRPQMSAAGAEDAESAQAPESRRSAGGAMHLQLIAGFQGLERFPRLQRRQRTFEAGEVELYSDARFPKFVRHRGYLSYELRKAKGTSKPYHSSAAFDLKSLYESCRRPSQGLQIGGTRHGLQDGKPVRSHQACIAEISDALAGLHPGDVLAKLDKSVRVDQRGQQPRAFTRKLSRFKRAVRRSSQADADIFAPA